MLKEFSQDIWQILLMNNLNFDAYLSLCTTISLSLLGVGVSVFTLTTAFIISKKDVLRNILKQIEIGGSSISLLKQKIVVKNLYFQCG